VPTCEDGSCPRNPSVRQRNRGHDPGRVAADLAVFPIVRLRYTAADKSWTLYWRDRNLRCHLYDLHAPSTRVDDLLTEIDHDPTSIFWG
jgi:hypothetical protein